MPHRLPPMPDSPRELTAPAVPLCAQCSTDGVFTTGCQKPNLHAPVSRFWDRHFLSADDPAKTISGSSSTTMRSPRASALEPLDTSGRVSTSGERGGMRGRHSSGDAGVGGYGEGAVQYDSGRSSPDDNGLLPPVSGRRNILPPLPPRVEMAVMRKLYMAGMTVSPRSRQIKPLPRLGQPEAEVAVDADGDPVASPIPTWEVEHDSDLEEDLPPTAYDPSLLDESLVRELSLDDLLRPEVPPPQRPQRMRLDPIRPPTSALLTPVPELFSPRPMTRQALSIPCTAGVSEEE